MARADDAVIDRDALVHVREVVLLEAELRVAVKHERDRLAVILLHQLLELEECLVEGVVVVELHRAVQGDRRLRPGRRGSGATKREGDGEEPGSGQSSEHRFLPKYPIGYLDSTAESAAPVHD